LTQISNHIIYTRDIESAWKWQELGNLELNATSQQNCRQIKVRMFSLVKAIVYTIAFIEKIALVD
jgi:hypothetical protein